MDKYEGFHYCQVCEKFVVAHEHVTLQQYQVLVDRAIANYVKRHKVKRPSVKK